ncbi:MAG TPA: pyrroline-5-carboxylate reductase [Gammaproteobacteria bacterium]|nr:pyrroline-5-carboxylate reductase [Gammaproteobacteria bacterium]
MENTRITFIGCGNMGRSLIGGMIADGYPKNRIVGCDIDSGQREQIAQQFGIETLQNSNDAVRGTELVVLAVKPQVMHDTLRGLRETLLDENPLLLSIAAGIQLKTLARWSSDKLAIVRAMPNTPSLVQTGAAALCANSRVNKAQRSLAEKIMRSVGTAIWLHDESLMDAVTAVSGSGPAYFFYIMEIMQKAASELGLDEDQSRLLVLETALGAAKMALESKYDPATLRKQVSSPGGTTEQALRVLQEGQLDRLLTAAIRAAHDRSTELATSFDKDQD